MNIIAPRPVDAVIAGIRDLIGERLSTAQAVREQHSRGEDQTPPTLPDAVAFVRAFVETGKPVASICHGPWTLAEADCVRGRRLTSWPSIRTDLRNAGAEVVDEEVCVDGQLTTSRSPQDMPAFCAAIVEQFAAVPAGRS